MHLFMNREQNLYVKFGILGRVYEMLIFIRH